MPPVTRGSIWREAEHKAQQKERDACRAQCAARRAKRGCPSGTTSPKKRAVVASVPSIPALLDDTCKCGVCFDLLAVPTSFPCGHTFCYECCWAWCMREAKKDCPTCRREVDSFADLKTNQVVENIMEAAMKGHARCTEWAARTASASQRRKAFRLVCKITSMCSISTSEYNDLVKQGVALNDDYCVGLAHLQGVSVPKDRDKGIAHLRDAVKDGNPEAMATLGWVLNGRQWNGPKLAELIDLVKKSALRESPTGNYMLAYALHHGKGIEKDDKAAIWFLRDACRQKHAPALALMGDRYFEGWDAARDLKRCIRSWTEALRLGHQTISLRLAKVIMFMDHPHKVIDYLEYCAQKGIPEAALRLGEMYASGKGVPENPELAFKFYKIGAELGHGHCQRWLGRCFEIGFGTAQDEEKAEFWVNKAIEAGIDVESCS